MIIIFKPDFHPYHLLGQAGVCNRAAGVVAAAAVVADAAGPVVAVAEAWDAAGPGVARR